MCVFGYVFFFKQKTAYEMRISDWSSDVCSSDLFGANYDHAWLMLPRFPDWATIPGHYSLAMSRRWHLAFALIFLASLLLYLLWSLLNRHFSRDLSVRREDVRPSHIWRDIKDHALLRFQVGEAARHYNVLQKLSYAVVLFILLQIGRASCRERVCQYV